MIFLYPTNNSFPFQQKTMICKPRNVSQNNESAKNAEIPDGVIEDREYTELESGLSSTEVSFSF